MSPAGWALDVAIVTLILGLAWRLLWTRHLFEAVVLFVAFGLTLSLAWVRLDATDLALAEAALGAGLTGALFMHARQRLTRKLAERAEERE